MQKKLLFICLGNICRSPAAEGVMKSIVERHGMEDRFYIDSAGIGGWHVGDLPDIRMRREGARRGYNFNSRARQFTPEDFNRFDILLVMDSENWHDVRRRCPDMSKLDKLQILADYMTRHPNVRFIPDPYYGNENDFRYALDLIEDACEGLFSSLKREVD